MAHDSMQEQVAFVPRVELSTRMYSQYGFRPDVAGKIYESSYCSTWRSIYADELEEDPTRKQLIPVLRDHTRRRDRFVIRRKSAQTEERDSTTNSHSVSVDISIPMMRGERTTPRISSPGGMLQELHEELFFDTPDDLDRDLRTEPSTTTRMRWGVCTSASSIVCEVEHGDVSVRETEKMLGELVHAKRATRGRKSHLLETWSKLLLPHRSAPELDRTARPRIKRG